MNTNEFGPKKLYRARDGFCFGIAKGFANYLGLPVALIRIVLIITFILSGFFPIVIAYIVAAIIIPKEPVLPPTTPDDQEFYNSYSSSKTMALARLKRKFEQLDRRTQRIESMVTAKEFAWEHRLRTGQ